MSGRSGGGFERDYAGDVNRGLIPGVSRAAALSHRVIPTAFSSLSSPQDVWPGVNAEMTFPTANESWEVVSTSPNDALGGSGAETATFTCLDFAYGELTLFTVNLNGTTPVILPNGATYGWLNNCSPGGQNNAAQRRKNNGDIIIRVAGSAGDNTKVRGVIPAFTGALSQAVYTVPIGKTLTIYSLEIEIIGSGGGVTRGADFRLNFRNPNGFTSAPRVIGCTDFQPYPLNLQTRIRVAQRFNFIPQCVYTSSNNMTVGVSWEGILNNN